MAAEFDGLAIARHRIAKEARERTGRLDLTALGLEELPPEVAGLAHLRELNLARGYGQRIRNDAGQVFESQDNRIADLGPLAQLTALQSLDCAFTQVADLAPLRGLTALRSLSFSLTPVADLAPVARLTALQSLDCSGTQVVDLAPLAPLTALQSLNASARKSPTSRLSAD